MSATSKFFWGTLAGAAAASAAAIFLHSKKGKEMISGMNESANRARDNLRGKFHKYQDELRHTMHRQKRSGEEETETAGVQA